MPTAAASLRSDLQRFISPMARRLRQGDAAAVAAVSGAVQKQYDKNLPAHRVTVCDRLPGLREPVTCFSTRMNSLLNRSLVSPNGIDATVPLYRCPICCSTSKAADALQVQWMAPVEITRHMSWLHASSGSSQSSFSAFNALEMKRLFRALASSADAPHTMEKTESLARVVVLLDVANIELGTEDVLFQLLDKEESLLFFRRVACAFVCVHEVFIPHTSRPGHICFQLSRLHQHSDMFTIYAATRSESGDLVTATVMGELLLQNVRGCGPAVVLLTKDRTQKSCVAEMFGGVAGKGGRVFLPRMTFPSILGSLREANNSSMG